MSGGRPGSWFMAAHYSIGEVLDLLKGDFPDVTISKIRFLESQGLIEPERTPSGYRKFSEEDIERLRWVLVQQRDHFLPLRVIRQRLDGEAAAVARHDGIEVVLDDHRGDTFRREQTQEVAVDPTPDDPARRPPPRRSGQAPGAGPKLPAIFADRARPAPPPDLLSVSLTGEELAEASGLRAEHLAELEHFGIIVGRTYGSQRVYDDDALLVARAAAGLLAHGLEARHLRSYLLAAQREAGLLEQAVAPLRRHRDPASRQRGADVIEELVRHGEALRSALVRRELRGQAPR